MKTHDKQTHPHAALISEYANDAMICQRPYLLWEEYFKRSPSAKGVWLQLDDRPRWAKNTIYRRRLHLEKWWFAVNRYLLFRQVGMGKPNIHAEAMHLFAEDAKKTSAPWLLWEEFYISTRIKGSASWRKLIGQPAWFNDRFYRRIDASFHEPLMGTWRPSDIKTIQMSVKKTRRGLSAASKGA